MYNREIIGQLVDFISSKDGRTDKSRLQNEVQEAFGLVKDRSVYYCDWFRFLYKGIIIKHNKTEPTYTKTSLFLCEKRRFFMARTEKGVVATI